MANQISRRMSVSGTGLRVLAGVAAVVLSAGAATSLAQSAPAGETKSEAGGVKRYNYDRRLGGGEASRGAQVEGEGGGGRSVTLMQSTDEDHTYTVRIEDGTVVSAQVDGAELPKDRIRRSGDKVELLDEKGNVVHTVQVPASPISVPGSPIQLWRQGGGKAGGKVGTWQFEPGGAAMAQGFSAPPVMLGITMSTPEDDMAGHLGVKADEVIRIDSVLEGLPAAKAGLQINDIIVAIDGDKPVNQEKLREILRGKKPGETVKLAVIRKGKSENIKVALEAYNAEKLSPAGAMTMNVEPGEQWQGMEGLQGLQGMLQGQWVQAKPHFEEACKEIESAIKELSGNEDLSAESMKSAALAALNQALAELKEQGQAAKQHFQHFTMPTTPVPGGKAEGPRPQVYITPMPGGGQGAQQGAQMERLNAALERMEKRLAELEERLDRRQRDAESREDRPNR